MGRAGPRRVRQYSTRFKLTAVRMSRQPGMQFQTVAAGSDIHPFMLSRWRTEYRDGVLRGRLPRRPAPGPARELRHLQAVERAHQQRKEEHDLLSKARRFCSARRQKSSPSSTPSAARTPRRASVDGTGSRLAAITPGGYCAWRRSMRAHAEQGRPLTFHSDRGPEYLAAPLRDRLLALGIAQSASESGAGDNAHMESFFHSFKAEVVRGETFGSEADLRRVLRHYGHYYNHKRLHSALGFRTPGDYELRQS